MSGKFLTATQYYKWQLEVEKVYKSEVKAKLVEAQAQILSLQLQNAKLKEMLHSLEVKAAKDKDEQVKKGYEQFMVSLNLETGIDLKGKAINPETFEVVDL